MTQHEATGAEDTLANQLQQAQLAVLAGAQTSLAEHPADTSAPEDSASGSQPGTSKHPQDIPGSQPGAANYLQDAQPPPLQPAPGSAAFHDILAGLGPGIAASGILTEDITAAFSKNSQGITDLLADL